MTEQIKVKKEEKSMSRIRLERLAKIRNKRVLPLSKEQFLKMAGVRK